MVVWLPGQYPRLSVRAVIDTGPDVQNQQHKVFSTLLSTKFWIETYTVAWIQ